MTAVQLIARALLRRRVLAALAESQHVESAAGRRVV
jgi:hypothetical protein